MQCSCGGATRTFEHVIKTDVGKENWGVSEKGVLTVKQERCESCGRQMTSIYDEHNTLIKEY